jgi:hypothetical protein
MSTTYAICWLKSILHEEKRREQENHHVEQGLAQDRKGLIAMSIFTIMTMISQLSQINIQSTIT